MPIRIMKKILDLPQEENEEEKITLPYKSMYDFFDKKLFFMRLDKLNTGYFKNKTKKKKKIKKQKKLKMYPKKKIKKSLKMKK